MSKRFLKLLAMPLFLLAASVSSAVTAHQYHTDQMRAEMKQMNWNLRRTAKAENIEQLQNYVKKIRQHAKNASADANVHAPAEFRQGMKELQAHIEKVQQAIEQGDIKQARKQLKVMRKLKKKYHAKLDI